MTGTPDASEPGKLIADATAVLYRSYFEIATMLEALAHENAMLHASVGDEEVLFTSRLLEVDRAGRHFTIAYCDESKANSALLDQQSVRFVAYQQSARLEFEAPAPSDAVFDGAPAIRLGIPESLVRSQRRQHPRLPVPGEVSVRCVADASGVIPFEARIVDISLGGMGVMTSDADVHLVPGSVLKGCRIVTPSGDSVTADLEVRYTKTVVQPDGSLANRSGVSFLQRPREIDDLIDVFVHNLDRKQA